MFAGKKLNGVKKAWDGCKKDKLRGATLKFTPEVK